MNGLAHSKDELRLPDLDALRDMYYSKAPKPTGANSFAIRGVVPVPVPKGPEGELAMKLGMWNTGNSSVNTSSSISTDASASSSIAAAKEGERKDVLSCSVAALEKEYRRILEGVSMKEEDAVEEGEFYDHMPEDIYRNLKVG